jgi:hypothetical protein
MKSRIKKARKFLKDHKGHDLFPCDNPKDKTRGICCGDCDVTSCDTYYIDFDSDPVLSKWSKKFRKKMKKRSKRHAEISRVVREHLNAQLPEVRMTANWCG